jgi:hypothetical protein
MLTHRNFQALHRLRFFLPLFFLPALVEAQSFAASERWYLSNKAGLALEAALSRYAALRGNYALAIREVPPAALPPRIRHHYREGFAVENRVLYKDGAEFRRQWILRDEAGRRRLIALVDEEAGDEADEKTVDPSFFIEIYGDDGLISGEYQSSAGEEQITNYYYTRQTLVRAEGKRKTKAEDGTETITDVYTDTYRYTRSGALRSIERVYHEEEQGRDKPVLTAFPFRNRVPAGEKDFIKPFNPIYVLDAIRNLNIVRGFKILYNTDERGRVLSEIREDEEGNVIGVFTNTWSGDRLVSAVWKSEADERLFEFEYNDEGDWIGERDYNHEVLERTIRKEKGREVEELYMNGMVILRAIWEDGKKISEERIRAQ